ncbi:MAG: hypothetical protein JWO23_1829, partial [Solirubrobacterales bacterium]|nr:hypothetical protein [Solirubrobacterales bacterium]
MPRPDGETIAASDQPPAASLTASPIGRSATTSPLRLTVLAWSTTRAPATGVPSSMRTAPTSVRASPGGAAGLAGGAVPAGG